MLHLDNNENLFGASPLAIQAAAAALTAASFYPSADTIHFARFLNVEESQITLGNGSENILELIVKTFLHPQDHALISQYAFITIPRILRHHHIQVETVPAHDYGHDLAAMLSAIKSQTRMIFIVNPNNPTGTCIPAADLRDFIAAVPKHIFVVLDEAYREYLSQAYPDIITWLHDYPNLIVVRTFSKAYGLAGLRLGYAVSTLTVAEHLNQVRLPFNINRIALVAAETALNDKAHMQHILKSTEQGKAEIIAGLRALNLCCLPAHGNFITFNVGRPAAEVHFALQKQGIKLKLLTDYDLPAWLRVTVGNSQQNALFLKGLEACFSQVF